MKWRARRTDSLWEEVRNWKFIQKCSGYSDDIENLYIKCMSIELKMRMFLSKILQNCGLTSVWKLCGTGSLTLFLPEYPSFANTRKIQRFHCSFRRRDR